MKGKNSVKILMIMLAFTVITAGCGNADSNAADTAAQKGINREENQNDGWQDNGPMNQSEGMRFQQPDLSGEIVSISDNSITVKVIEMSDMPGIGERQMGSRYDSTEVNSDNSQPTSPGREGNTEGSKPEAGQPEGSKSGQGIPDGGQPVQRNMELKYTGETKTVTIPEGISIMKSGRWNDDGQQQQNTVALSELKEGDILQIWYNDKEEVVSKAMLLSIR